MKIDDIEGCRANPEKELRKTNFMDPRDINKEFTFTSSRSVDPLRPEYLIRDDTGYPLCSALVTIGPVQGSQPRQLVKTSTEAHFRHLKTDDIDGATASTKGLGPFANKPRSTVRNSIDVSDIDGTKMESLRRGPVTTRCVNPNAPVYQYPGHSEEPKAVLETKVVPLVEKHFTENEGKFFGVTPAPSVRRGSGNRENSPGGEAKKEDWVAEANRAKFYGDDSRLQSPRIREEQLQRNRQRFYSNTPPFGRPPVFEEVFRTGSIQLPKPTNPLESINPSELHQSAKAFYAASSTHPRSPGSELPSSRGSITSQRQLSSPKEGEEGGKTGYKFAIPRAEIGAASSRGSSLKSSARKVLET